MGEGLKTPINLPEEAVESVAICQQIFGKVVIEVNDIGFVPPVVPAGHSEVADAVWARLNALAMQTYVPETEASRLSGAGAGLVDDD